MYFLSLLQDEKLRHTFCHKVIVPTLCAQSRTRFHLEVGIKRSHICFATKQLYEKITYMFYHKADFQSPFAQSRTRFHLEYR